MIGLPLKNKYLQLFRTVFLFACAMACFTAAAETSPAMPLVKSGPASVKNAQDDKPNYPCMVMPSLEIDVGTPVDGILEIVTVDRGDMVATGKLLARLNTGVDAASVEHQAAKAEFGSRKLARNEELQSKMLISNQELDEIETEYRLAELELNQKREQLKLRSIVSPINGVIVDRYRSRGDLVKQEKIFRIAQLNPLHVEAVVPASLFRQIRVGQSYQVMLPLLGIKIMANVSNVDKVIDAASGTFRVRLLLPNPKYELPSGLRCGIDF